MSLFKFSNRHEHSCTVWFMVELKSKIPLEIISAYHFKETIDSFQWILFNGFYTMKIDFNFEKQKYFS